MSRTAASGRGFWLSKSLVPGMVWVVCLAVPAMAGPYRDSAHGSDLFGANRSAIDAKYTAYATGNCAHCHEMHASLDGAEPAPVSGPAAHALFAANFNTDRMQNNYLEADNFCFSCHSDTAGPQVINQDYSGAFGGATPGTGPQSILAAFNQTSYHNLYDIWNYLRTNSSWPWFGTASNPCSGCHNPHLAKRNWDSAQPGFPLLSAISRPGSPRTLWGESEVMSSYFSYEAPYAIVGVREPAGFGDPSGANTPDYVGFCGNCHSPLNVLWSTTLNREIKKIDWGATGPLRDKHGATSRDNENQLREPYASAAALKSNFVLSCLDCHESHGSENIMLLRRRVNGEDMEGAVSSTDAMGYACRRCHADDLAAAAGTNQENRWQYVHHGRAGAPYAESGCESCHAGGDGNVPIACGNCHGHGMDDSWAGALATGRKTF